MPELGGLINKLWNVVTGGKSVWSGLIAVVLIILLWTEGTRFIESKGVPRDSTLLYSLWLLFCWIFANACVLFFIYVWDKLKLSGRFLKKKHKVAKESKLKREARDKWLQNLPTLIERIEEQKWQLIQTMYDVGPTNCDTYKWYVKELENDGFIQRFSETQSTVQLFDITPEVRETIQRTLRSVD